MNKEQEQSIDEKEKRKQLEKEIWWLTSMALGESFSSLAVKSFINRQFKAEKLRAILWLSDETGVPISLIEKRSRMEHNVIANLIDKGEKEFAREAALDPKAVREKRPELFDQAQAFCAFQRVVNDTPKVK